MNSAPWPNTERRDGKVVFAAQVLLMLPAAALLLVAIVGKAIGLYAEGPASVGASSGGLAILFAQVVCITLTILAVSSRKSRVMALPLLAFFVVANGYSVFRYVTMGSVDCDCFGALQRYAQHVEALRNSVLRNAVCLAMLSVAAALPWMTSSLGRPAAKADANSIRGNLSCGRRPAFSIVELAVVIFVVAVLVAVLLPVLSSTVDDARTTLSLSRARTHANAVTAYAAESGRDGLPWPGSPDGTGLVRAEGESPIPYFAFCSAWAGSLGRTSHYDAGSSESFASPFGDGASDGYWLSCSTFAAPEYWNTTTRTGVSQLVQVRMSNAVYPSSKVVVMDVERFASVFRGDLAGGHFIASYLDGSADASDGPTGGAVESGDGFFGGAVHLVDLGRAMHTWDGIRGRDR